MRVHRNLHNAKRGGPQWTVTARGRVVEYRAEVRLLLVTTRIQPAGAARCRSSGVRSVCAYFDGADALASDNSADFDNPALAWCRVEYDPRADTAFHANGRRFDSAALAWLRSDGSTLVLHPRWSH